MNKVGISLAAKTIGRTIGDKAGNVLNDTERMLSSEEITKIKAEIKKLEADLQRQMATPPKGRDPHDWGYYEIYMDKLQNRIKELRKLVPVDKTNIEEVMMAKPMEYFVPNVADNIKGKGISFLPVLPSTQEELAKVTYQVVPIHTNARTIEEMVRIGKRDGINIEVVQLGAKGEYTPAIKNVWESGETPTDPRRYFVIDKPSAAIKYEKLSADDPYIDGTWAQANKDANNEVTNAAVIANSKKVPILSKAYVHQNGTPITPQDMVRWNGFPAHKDGSATINAVAFDGPKDLMTLEGPIKEDVTMGDVEGYVYNNFKELKKQITKNKIKANPQDPNSQAFIDLIKDGKDDEALSLLRKITAETM